MTRSPRTLRTGVAVVIGAMIGAVALTGCGAGQITGTSSQISAIGGANANVGPIAVRDVQFVFGDDVTGPDVYRVGENAPLEMTVVNNGSDPDRLVSVTSPAATSVQVSGNVTIFGGRSLLVAGAPSTSSTASSTASSVSATASASASAQPTSAAPTTSGAASAATTPVQETPAGQPVPTVSPDVATTAHVVLVDLLQNIRAGLTYPVTMRFERAGEVTVYVPVNNPNTPRSAEPGE